MREEAARICMKGLERGLEKGRSLRQVTASSLYAACRERGIPTTLDDLAEASGVRRNAIARCYRLLVRELDMEIPVVDLTEYMQEVASKANMTAQVQVRALEILHRAEKEGVTDGMDPLGLTGSVLYMAALLEGQKLTQKNAADAAGVTEATLRNELRRLKVAVAV